MGADYYDNFVCIVIAQTFVELRNFLLLHLKPAEVIPAIPPSSSPLHPLAPPYSGQRDQEGMKQRKTTKILGASSGPIHHHG